MHEGQAGKYFHISVQSYVDNNDDGGGGDGGGDGDEEVLAKTCTSLFNRKCIFSTFKCRYSHVQARTLCLQMQILMCGRARKHGGLSEISFSSFTSGWRIFCRSFSQFFMQLSSMQYIICRTLSSHCEVNTHPCLHDIVVSWLCLKCQTCICVEPGNVALLL